MRKSLLNIVFFPLMCINCLTSYAQDKDSTRLIVPEFPTSWVGDWRGELQIFGTAGLKQSLPMQLKIQPIDSLPDYSFTIIYELDTENGERAYTLKTIDAAKGHYAIDEQNSIQIDAFLLGNKLVQRFEVMGNLLDTFIEKEGDHLIWEIFSGKLSPTSVSGNTNQAGEDIPEVKAYPMAVYQKCILSRVE